LSLVARSADPRPPSAWGAALLAFAGHHSQWEPESHNQWMSPQFNSEDGSGYVLQPLAVKPPVVAPPEVIGRATPLPTPSEPLPAPSESVRIT
jgi:hypothetical protein